MMLKLWLFLFFKFVISVLIVFPVFANQQGKNILPVVESPKPDVLVDNAFYDDKKHGWYWYEKNPEQLKKEIPKLDKTVSLVPYSYDDLWTMYPDNFQELLELIKKKAVQYPTKDNVKDFMFMQNIARRKALAFASVFSYVAQNNHELTTKDVFPITKPGQRARITNIKNEKNNVIRTAREDFALIMFFSNDCSYCQAQLSILGYFMDSFQWPIRMIDINENPNMAARFNVSVAPQTILIYKKTKNYMPISSGVISLSELKTKLYRSIRLMRGEITPQQWFLYEFEKNKSADPLKYVGKNVQIK